MVFLRTLGNGIRVIGEVLPQYRSVSVGVWVNTGSVREAAAESGASHFIEHMLFKGTNTRSASQIAGLMDGVGATLNAFTSKECTCFYVKVLDEHLEIGVELLADILMNSVFDPKEIKKEQGVVVEEILMMQDSPEDLAHETLAQIYFQDDPLSQPILGTRESVTAFTRKSLLDYMHRHYGADSIVIACAGNVEEDRLMGLVEQHFGGHSRGTPPAPVENRVLGGQRFAAVEKEAEQVHICIGLPGYAVDTPGQYPLFVLNNALGSGMSSRLFQKIREDRGLAYSVYSYPVSYTNAGCFGLYAGTGEKQAHTVCGLMLDEMEQILKDGLTQEEFERSKRQLKGNYLLGQESTSGRMNALGKSLLLLGRIYSEQERLEQIAAITMDDVAGILPVVFARENTCISIVGKVEKQKAKIQKLL